MVGFPLEAGAVELVDVVRLALELAIANGHEQIAIRLSQELLADAMIFKGGYVLLQLACEARLANLVRFLLRRGYQRRAPTEITRDYSMHLHRLIAKDSAGSGYVKCGSHDEVYQIAIMLLQHRADPDTRREGSRGVFVSTQRLACRHSDPRVRNMLSRAWATHTPRCKAAHLQIGHSRLNPAARSFCGGPPLSLSSLGPPHCGPI